MKLTINVKEDYAHQAVEDKKVQMWVLLNEFNKWFSLEIQAKTGSSDINDVVLWFLSSKYFSSKEHASYYFSSSPETCFIPVYSYACE